ncbi:hypothetical protein GGX14DRAFT_409879 [Mycena pura]|uniref:BTB domain-containing protein n=1 Tax=Mycena pura TaxID=153505 RepID=A0AAD6YUV1_9AGAR|nr:hypothetical protein GGX14DRAFT_409879 [Mycena pura]
MADQSQAPKLVPPSPFCDPTADIILRSSDNIEFRAHRIVLSLASPVFRDMFSLPQGDAESDEKAAEVQMAETGAVLERMLRFWYPGAEPIVGTLSELRETLELLIQKYDMQSAAVFGKQYLRGFLDTEPLGTFAVAARFGWKDLTLLAARECLKLPLRNSAYTPPNEFDCVSAKVHHALIQYHYRCGEVVRDILKDRSFPDAARKYEFSPYIQRCRCRILSIGNGNSFEFQFWFTEFLQSMEAKHAKTPGAVDDLLLILKAVKGQKSADCSNCNSVSENLPIFLSEWWWPTIKASIGKVSLDL